MIVVAIIAVLISILAPALQVAKEHATASVCLGNQKSLTGAWIFYHEGNRGRLVGGDAGWEIPPDNPPNEDLVWLARAYGGLP